MRVVVDHLFRGTTRVWWRLDPLSPPPPHIFKLQASYTGNANSLDWVDVAEDVGGTYLTHDSAREMTGKHLLTHYRVTLQAGGQTFLSAAAPVWGMMSQQNWTLAQEIARKFMLNQARMSGTGYLLRRMRYGAQDPAVVDQFTGAQSAAFSRTSWGTPFKVGYHPPVMVSLELQSRGYQETKGGTAPEAHSGKSEIMAVRALAIPQILPEDVWVNSTTDERWRVDEEIKVLSPLEGVPIIVGLQLIRIPQNDIVYHIPVDAWSFDAATTAENELPTLGQGCVPVDHDYPTDEIMTYATEDCCAIEGATIRVFTKTDWDNNNRDAADVVASSITTLGGRWAYAVKLDPGAYIVEFALAGSYGPDIVELQVVAPELTSSSASGDSDSVAATDETFSTMF